MKEVRIKPGEVRIYDPASANMSPVQPVNWEFTGLTPEEFRRHYIEWALEILDAEWQKLECGPIPMPRAGNEGTIPAHTRDTPGSTPGPATHEE